MLPVRGLPLAGAGFSHKGGITVSRLALIIAALAVGVVLAVGAAFTTASVVQAPPAPANQAPYNYGTSAP
jgi:hypothetical protein